MAGAKGKKVAEEKNADYYARRGVRAVDEKKKTPLYSVDDWGVEFRGLALEKELAGRKCLRVWVQRKEAVEGPRTLIIGMVEKIQGKSVC